MLQIAICYNVLKSEIIVYVKIYLINAKSIYSNCKTVKHTKSESIKLKWFKMI